MFVAVVLTSLALASPDRLLYARSNLQGALFRLHECGEGWDSVGRLCSGGSALGVGRSTAPAANTNPEYFSER